MADDNDDGGDDDDGEDASSGDDDDGEETPGDYTSTSGCGCSSTCVAVEG